MSILDIEIIDKIIFGIKQLFFNLFSWRISIFIVFLKKNTIYGLKIRIFWRHVYNFDNLTICEKNIQMLQTIVLPQFYGK